MTIFPSGKGVSVRREVFQPTKDTPIKPSLLILTNAKDNEIIDLIYDHAYFVNSLMLLYILVNIPKNREIGRCNRSSLRESF